MKTLVLGMGNPILGDDGVGLVVARALEGKAADTVVATSTMIGLDLMDIMTGYDRVFVIDAMCTREGEPGEVRKISPERGPGTMHLFTSHGLHFFEIVALARNCGLDMPEIGAVYGIEIGEAVCFDEELSDALRLRLDGIIETILRDMG